MTKQSVSKHQVDEEYVPNRQNKLVFRKKKSSAVPDEFRNSSKWNLEQNKRFLNFLIFNKELLSCSLRRKEQRVFLQLSKIIATRTPDQCRSHHQKMIKHHNDLDGIIEHLDKKISILQIPNHFTEDLSVSNEVRANKERVETNYVFNTKIDIQIESEESMERDLWNIFNQQIWIQKPAQLFNGL